MEIKDIQKLADLARIEISPEEQVEIMADLAGILHYVDQIENAPISEIQIVGEVNVMREDINPHESGIFSEALLAELPEREGDYMKVKKIL